MKRAFLTSLFCLCIATAPIFGNSFPTYNDVSVFVDLTPGSPNVAKFGPDMNIEGLTVGPDNHIYATRYYHGTIFKISPDGKLSVYAQLPDGGQSSGLGFDGDGNLFIAYAHLDENNQPTSSSGVWMVANDSDCEMPRTVKKVFPLHGEVIYLPDGLVADSKGVVYVGDNAAGNIWRFNSKRLNRPGDLWAGTDAGSNPNYLEGLGFFPPGTPFNLLGRGSGVNDLALDDTETNLYASNTELAAVIRIPIKRNGTAGVQVPIVEKTYQYEFDGLFFDKVSKKLYVTVLAELAGSTVGPGHRILAADLKGNHHDPLDFEVIVDNILLGTPTDIVTGRGFGPKKHSNYLYISDIGAPGISPLGPNLLVAIPD